MKLKNGHFVLLSKEGLDNVLHKVNSSDDSLYKTQCTVKIYDEARDITKEYVVYRDKKHRSYFTPHIDGIGISTVFLDEFREVE